MTDFGTALSRDKGVNLKLTRLDNDSIKVQFPGYVTTFQDNYTSNYNSTNVYGRMDPIMTFQNTQRKITIGFRVVGDSAINMIDNQDRLRTLITMLYPRYTGQDIQGTQVMNSSPLVRVEYANYIPNLVCAIDGLDYNPPFGTDQAWLDYENGIAPTYFDLSLGLTIIHEATMGFDAESKIADERFIPDDTVITPAVPVIGYGTANDSLAAYRDELDAALTPTETAEEAASDPAISAIRSRREARQHKRRSRRAQRRIERAEALRAEATDILTAPGIAERTEARAAELIAGFESGE